MQRNLVYVKLQSWQTRLIKLLPAALLEDGVKCTLHVADLVLFDGLGVADEAKIHKFEAVSYSWGSGARNATIICNGIRVMVPPPLEEALRHFRYEDKARWMWCDALCINQEDALEKSTQVRLLQTIFGKADRVLAWLGLPDNPLTHVLQINVVLIMCEHYNGNYRIPQEDLDELTHALREIQSRKWFSRTWVRQEVYSAANLFLVSGKQEIDFASFVKIAKSSEIVASSLSILNEDFENGIRERDLNGPYRNLVLNPRTMELAGEPVAGSQTSDLLHLLRNNHSFGATDERDRLYALLGMLPFIESFNSSAPNAKFSNTKTLYPIDYNKHVSGVYQDLIKYVINLEGRLDILNCFGSWATKRQEKGLPSWAIDWRDPEQSCAPVLYSPLATPGDAPRQHHYNSGKLILKGVQILNLFKKALFTSVDQTSNIGTTREAKWQKRVLQMPLMPKINLIAECGMAQNPAQVPEIQPWEKVCNMYRQGCFQLYTIESEASDRYRQASLVDSSEMDHLWGPERCGSWDLVVPQACQAGDTVVLLCGSEVLYVVRKLLPSQEWMFLGPCWVRAKPELSASGDAIHYLTVAALFDTISRDGFNAPNTVKEISSKSLRNHYNLGNDPDIETFVFV